MKFYYVVANNIFDISINFSNELMHFKKSYAQTHLILLQLSWNLVYGLRMVRSYIPTKFKENLRTLKFLVNFYALWNILAYDYKIDHFIANQPYFNINIWII